MNDDYPAILNGLLDGAELTESQAAQLMHDMASGDMAPAMAGAFLAGLRAKGETAAEIRGFATAMRDLARHPEIPDGPPTVDTVGTGGDGSHSLNLSTGTGLLAAAAGARVVKHGNRSVSSKSGSADLLESLGMPIPLDEEASIAALEALNFTFLFAPAYHPAMKSIMLGPLANPAAPPYNLIGAFSAESAKLMAETLSGMPIERAFVVHGEPGWDEATPAGEFLLYDVRPGSVEKSTRTPEEYGMQRCAPEELRGKDAAHNADELVRVMTGDDTGPHRDALVMGTSLVLEVTGLAGNLKEGVDQASAVIDSGGAADFLERFRIHFSGR